MPELKPFIGVRYSDLDRLADLVCSPYDLITPPEQRRLHERHRYNAVRIELPYARPGETAAQRYARAGAEFRSWIETGVLVTESRPHLYAYSQEYDAHERRGRVAGVIGALSVTGYRRPEGILPHENTMPGPIRDRLALLHAYPFNISPVQVIYRGGGAIAPLFAEVERRTPDQVLRDDSGIVHRLWNIADGREIDAFVAPLRAGPAIIADGHHRFETALAYHEEMRGRPGGHHSLMCFCVDADHRRPVVRPWHRLVRARVAVSDIAARLERWTSPSGEPGAHAFEFVLPGRTVKITVPRAEVDAVAPARPMPWRRLDVVALHEVVLPEVFGDAIEELRFTAETEDLGELVARDGFTAGVMLRPPGVEDIIEVALAGERVPPKSSYFWPKPLTGLVFRSLE